MDVRPHRETAGDVLADSLTRLGPARSRPVRRCWVYRFARQRLQDSAANSAARPRGEPVVLFLCTQSAGRSQMAAALLEHAAEGRVVVRSAGTEPADQVHDEVVDALGEVKDLPMTAIETRLQMSNTSRLIVTLGREAVVESAGGPPSSTGTPTNLRSRHRRDRAHALGS